MQGDNYDTDRIDVDESIRERHDRIADQVLSHEDYGHLIGGEWVDGESGERMTARDATTGEVLATVPRGTAADVDRAVAAASDAFEGTWGQQSPQQRSDLLHEIADRIEQRKTEIARLDSLEVGKPNKHSLLVDTTVIIEQLRHFASLARTADDGRRPPANSDRHVYTRREPYGVVGCVSAWNFPALFVAWKLGPALAAGNAVVYKPSSRAVLSTLELLAIADDVLPAGAVNAVTGTGSEVGDALTGHPEVRKVSLTGSKAAGTAAMQNAAEHVAAVSLELGGNNPNIVCADADVEQAVEGTLKSVVFNQGQQCTAGARLFVHSDIYDEFMTALTNRLDEMTLGDPLSPMTTVGPLIDHAHQRDVLDYVESARADGATIAYEGSGPGDEVAGAPFVPPTIIEGASDDDAVVCEEVFGPVVTAFEWRDRETVLARANDTEYGLVAGVWTQDLEAAHEMAAELEAGTVWVNDYLDMFEPAPYGGYKQSGIGRELAAEALDAYQQTKTVAVSMGDITKFQ